MASPSWGARLGDGSMGARGARAALWGVALLCALGLGQCTPGVPRCDPGRRLKGTGTNARCCGPCDSAQACPGGPCTCLQPEFHCGDPQCETCKRHPCPPGQKADPRGEYNYGFICIDCAEGTFSGGSEGRCDPWADCSRSGLRTLFPGNRTHDAVCELPPPPPPAEPRCPLTALLVLGACILAVVAAQLALQLWQLRRQLVQPPETQPLLEAPPVVEDTYSCQFPEEERGGRLSEDPGEDKGPPGNLWV
ncbi:tumor necrosis factor receptor superfamily member 18 isoform X2 [Phyllostomus discolor]|uniref:Tumor necrosis factor receptor superfamily member 18 isoform X2 n=2 Tax=Phyllostomus discolor TaxID=89673 RepID=A0A7E6DQG0_9CHIR|nr:tumor necrosis factor receptor superfamily member 18 isoform X2 [Phyllostomus discolor]